MQLVQRGVMDLVVPPAFRVVLAETALDLGALLVPGDPLVNPDPEEVVVNLALQVVVVVVVVVVVLVTQDLLEPLALLDQLGEQEQEDQLVLQGQQERVVLRDRLVPPVHVVHLGEPVPGV